MNEPISPATLPLWRRVLYWIGEFFYYLRQFIVNLMALLLLVLAVSLLLSSDPMAEIPDGAALVLNPVGAIVEETQPADPTMAFLGRSQGAQETRLSDVIAVLRAAAEDERIGALVLQLEQLSYASPAVMEEIGRALAVFRETGKPIVAAGNWYSQTQYYLASFADDVYMHPMGQLVLSGYGMFGSYYQGLLERFGVNVHVFRVGTYKAAVEPFTRSDMSPEAREANRELLQVLWDDVRGTIALNRGMTPSDVQAYADDLPEMLGEAAGDLAQAALEHGMVDELLTPDAVDQRLANMVGGDPVNGGWRHVSAAEYLPEARRLRRLAEDSGAEDAVALIVARGAVMMGEQPRDQIGAESVSVLIRQARESDSVKALVLRVDSPGGSALASELIRQELVLTQLVGKPVVVSMGGAAASGGYWIASSADQIWAAPTTITGSIGIFSIIPTFEAGLSEIGVNGDGVGVTRLAGGIDPLRGISEPMGAILQASVERGYQRFIELVAAGRELPLDTVAEIAEGRVWSGSQAAELGLVDHLGYLDQAIDSAAELADLSEYRLVRLREPESPQELLLRRVLEDFGLASAPIVRAPLDRIVASFETLTTLNDPQSIYAWCALCEVRAGAQGITP